MAHFICVQSVFCGVPCPPFRYVPLRISLMVICKSPFHTEPVGAKAPKFSIESTSSSFVKFLSQGFALLCPAQGYPVPSFR